MRAADHPIRENHDWVGENHDWVGAPMIGWYLVPEPPEGPTEVPSCPDRPLGGSISGYLAVLRVDSGVI